MISNTQNSNNLAKEVERKKKQMQFQQNSEKKRMIIAYSVVGAIALILIVFAVIQYGSSDEVVNHDFETPIGDTDKYNSKIEALEVKNKQVNNDNLLDIFTPEEDKISTEENTEEEDNLRKSIEALEPLTPNNDRLLEKLLVQQEENEKRAAEGIKNASKEKELTYSEKLAIEREKHFVIREEKEDEKEKVVFRGSVFRTQYVVPGERVDLMTSEEFIYNNTRFKKGMRFYAIVDIQETRILFDIDNIAHTPMKAEVRDIADGRIGLYSKQAGELWAIYQERLREEAGNNVTREISNGVKPPIISSTIQVLSNFFASKKGMQSKKLKIDNNSQFIVTLL